MGHGRARWVRLTLGSHRHNGVRASIGRTKTETPGAHGPCCGRGLDMAGHFKGRKKGRTKWSHIWGDVLDLKCRLQFHKCSLRFHVFIFTWGILNYKHGLLRAPVVFIWLLQSQTWRARLPERMFAPAPPADLWSAFELRAPSWTQRGEGLLSRVVGFYLTPWDDVKSTPSLCRCTHPPARFHMQGNWPNLWLCVGGWGSRLSASTPTVCVHKSGEEQIHWYY